MKCLYRQNLYGSGNLSKSTLIGETAGGDRQSLLKKAKKHNTILSMDNRGFKVENGKGEILRRGTDMDVFRIYDSLLFNPGDMFIRDKIRGVEMDFKTYEGKYGYDRVSRTEKAKFKLYAIQNDKETALGIEHYRGLNTLWIASVYFPEAMNGTEIADYATGFISEKLDANQSASVNAVGMPKDMRHPYVKIYKHEDDKRYTTVRELAEDAMERKETVFELLDGQEGEDKENDDARATTAL